VIRLRHKKEAIMEGIKENEAIWKRKGIFPFEWWNSIISSR